VLLGGPPDAPPFLRRGGTTAGAEAHFTEEEINGLSRSSSIALPTVLLTKGTMNA